MTRLSGRRRVLLARIHPRWRPARLGALRRMTPLSDEFGYDRGTPIDRYYIERFLAENRQHIQGRVLEVKDSGYSERFGEGVTRTDVLDIDTGNALATFVADLAAADTIPDATFDCFILTQTLQYVYDVRGGRAARAPHSQAAGDAPRDAPGDERCGARVVRLLALHAERVRDALR